MKPIYKRLLAAAMGLAALLVLGLAARKTVTLAVDGESRSLATYALTVGQLLRLEQIPLGAADSLTPEVGHWLRNGDTVTLERAVPVQIMADGVTHTLLTAERLPENLLALAGVSLAPGDLLLSNGTPVSPGEPLPRAASHTLQVRRAASLSLVSGQETHTITSTAASLGQALWQAGIPLYTADRLRPPPESPLINGLTATLLRSRQVTITTQSIAISVRTSASTVGEALAEAGLSLQGLDYSLPPAESPIPEDGQIRVVRLSETVIIEQTPLPFETQTTTLPDVELDTQQIVQPGAYGLAAKRVRVRDEDGVEVSRQTEGEWVARQPQARIVGYGAKIVMHTLDTPDGTISYWRALTFWATSYAPKFAGGDTTASGQKLRKGLVGVDRNYIPFGTLMYVPGYGYAEAADTGAISGRWIDLGYSDDDYEAWHQCVTVYFLWPPPAWYPLTIPRGASAAGYAPCP